MTDNLSHLQAVFAENTSDGILALLTLSSPFLGQPFRFVNDNVETLLVKGDTYLGFSFAIKFPDVNDRGISSIPITIGNVDPSIGQTIEAIDDALKAEIEVVRLEAPNQTLYRFRNFFMRNTKATLTTITGQLEYRSGGDFRFPRSRFNTTDFPGLGRGF